MARTLYIINKEETVIGCDTLTVANFLGHRHTEWQPHIQKLLDDGFPTFRSLLLENTDIVT
jgi:hypothetical protein